MKTIFRWLYAWLSQSFFGLIPPAIGLIGAIIFLNFFPAYGLLFAFIWIIFITYLSAKYFRFY